MGLRYTSVERIYQVMPQIGSLSDLTSAQIVTVFAEPAEALINAKIVKLYALPINDTVPMLSALADDVAVYRIMSRRIMSQEQLKNSTWPDRFKEALTDLDRIASGEIPLINSADNVLTQRNDMAICTSNTIDYLPTFHEGESETWVQDEEKLDDLLDDRGL